MATTVKPWPKILPLIIVCEKSDRFFMKLNKPKVKQAVVKPAPERKGIIN